MSEYIKMSDEAENLITPLLIEGDHVCELEIYDIMQILGKGGVIAIDGFTDVSIRREKPPHNAIYDNGPGGMSTTLAAIRVLVNAGFTKEIEFHSMSNFIWGLCDKGQKFADEIT